MRPHTRPIATLAVLATLAWSAAGMVPSAVAAPAASTTSSSVSPTSAADGTSALATAVEDARSSAGTSSAGADPEDADGVSSLDDFSRRVTKARLAVEAALPRLSERAVAGELAIDLVLLLPVTERVRVGDKVIRVDQSALRALVVTLDVTRKTDRRREAGEKIAGYLRSLEQAIGVQREAVADDPPALAKLVAAQAPSVDQGWALKISEWFDRLVEYIRSLIDSSGAAPGAGPVVDAVWKTVLALVVGLLLFAVWRTVRAWSRSTARKAREVPSDVVSVPIVEAEAELPPDVLTFADRLAGEGRLREAVRALFGGAARSLADAGLLHRTRTRTNSELLAEVSDTGAVRAPLAALSEDFELAWYGHVEPDETGFDDARERYRAVERAVRDAASSEGGGAS